MHILILKISFSFFLIWLTFINSSHLIASEIKIINKVNNEIITNIDVEIEYKYLLALNNELKELQKSEGLKIANDSLIREKIKINELEKYYDLKNLNNRNY